MAINAARWSRLVEKNLLVGDDPNAAVTRGAPYTLVRPLQRKRSFFVIEQGRPPFRAVVTFGAARDVRFRKLAPVNIAVAVLARVRCCFEIGVAQLHSHVRRLVAINARHRSMRPHQRELGGAVIKARQIRPCFRRVANFATDGALRVRPHHAFFELPVVRILMARCAGAIFKAVSDRLRFERILRLVTFVACRCDVAPGQNKARVLVARQCEG